MWETVAGALASLLVGAILILLKVSSDKGAVTQEKKDLERKYIQSEQEKLDLKKIIAEHEEKDRRYIR